ncbi:MAG: undecaprenyl-phosphate glucose phosphotransferase [Chloroflexota bacterium]
MSQRLRAALVLLTVLVDALMTTLALYLAYRLRLLIPFPTPLRLGAFGNFRTQLGFQILSVVVALAALRLYSMRSTRSRVDLLYRLVPAISLATLAATALSYLTYLGEGALARGMVLYGWVLSLPLVMVGRLLAGWVHREVRRHRPDQLLIVGTGDAARMILQKSRSPGLGYRVAGFVANGEGHGRAEAPAEIAGVPVLGTVAEIDRIIREHGIQEVVIALPEATHDELLDMVSACEQERASVRIYPDLFQIVASDLEISDLDGLPLLTVHDAPLRGGKLAIKRTMDLVGSAVGLVVLSPLMMLVALLIKLESKGPVFFVQTRMGLDGRPFPTLKFRSMRVDAEAKTGPVWATENDPRTTRLGRLLRSTSLDELPQLINVLVGDMSLVGPRPERPMFVEQFRRVIPRYMDRHHAKAGLTGWAQVNGLRGETSIVERTKYDLYYIENWSLLFDVKILIRQMLNQFRRDRNAY